MLMCCDVDVCCVVMLCCVFRVKLRQRVISSAVVFFKRFYLNRSFGEFDPRIIAPTMLFVAAKVEETYLNVADGHWWTTCKLKVDVPMHPVWGVLDQCM